MPGSYGVFESEYMQLQENDAIKTLELSKEIRLEDLPFQRAGIDIYFQSPTLLNTSFFTEARSLEGQLPKQPTEILVSEPFILENPEYSLGSAIRLGSKDYTICGVYKEHLYSFKRTTNSSVSFPLIIVQIHLRTVAMLMPRSGFKTNGTPIDSCVKFCRPGKGRRRGTA